MAAGRSGRRTASRKTAGAGRKVKRTKAASHSSPTRAQDSSPPNTGRPIVVIGASAGGLKAFKTFFAAMAPDSGLAFVLVPHLDPTHESLMVDLISKQTAMPVSEAADGTVVEPNHVYVIPPNRYLAVSEGTLRLSVPEGRSGPPAIDFAMQSLAHDQRERAIGVVLSGTGSHGTQGLKEIKLTGGMVMVQEPASADYEQMPRNAIATGLVDYVLRPEEMPAALLRYVAQPYLNHGMRGAVQNEPNELQPVLALLQGRTRFDFHAYRRSMLLRRVQRRMGLAQIEKTDGYVAYLREHPAEVEALYKDLLIGVTGFFREPAAFRLLEKRIIPELVTRTSPDRPIRVWVAGCATGEEAYSIAMLIAERCAAAGAEVRLQMFATDLDERALEIARKGVYVESALGSLSPTRRARFFTKIDDHRYRVHDSLRETIVFAAQNLIGDAPFSKLDLVSCRNVLIYLEPAAQEKVLALFHFALNEDGYLLLGPSESIGHAVDLFEPVSKRHRLYRRVGLGRRDLVEIPIQAANRRHAAAQPAPPHLKLSDVMRKALVDAYAPASVLINRRYEMLALEGPLDRYLTFPAGEMTKDLLSMARMGLRTKIRAACHRALRGGRPVIVSDARVARDGAYVRCEIAVRLLTEPTEADGLLLLTFRDQQPSATPPQSGTPEQPGTLEPQHVAESAAVQQLEQELRTTREDLQSTIEELESSNEELKSANEEAMSMNEELQSANEELETSKEELQSLNEEINTVNSQLRDKVEQLDQVNNDMTNLLAASDIAAVFLSPDLRIVRFTPAIAPLLNVVPGDVGRSLRDFAPHFDDDALFGDCRLVFERMSPIEREVLAHGGRSFLRRIRPYRTRNDRIDGVVITFFDITDRLALEREQQYADRDREEAERLKRMVDNLPAGALYLESDTILMNRAAERITGYGSGELSTRGAWFSALCGSRVQEAQAEYERQRAARFPAPFRTPITRKDGADRIIETVAHIFDDHEVWLLNDVTERLAIEEHTRSIVRAASDAIISIDATGAIESFNPAAERLFGYDSASVIGQNVNMLMPEPYRSEHDRYLARYRESRDARVIGIGRKVHGRRKDGTVFPVDLAVSEFDHGRRFTGILRDMTEQVADERRLAVARTQERTALARDLHDDLGGELTGIELLASSLTRQLEKDASPYMSRIKAIEDGIRGAHAKLREMARELKPVSPVPEGLLMALQTLMEDCSASHGIRCRVVSDPKVQINDQMLATQLFHIAKEAIRNALRHAAPHEITATLSADEQVVYLDVADDGVGIDSREESGKGLGLTIMAQRARELGGEATVLPRPEGGTIVSCRIPLRAGG